MIGEITMNICIVGYGAVAPVHANAIKNIDNACLYAVCDINNEHAEKCAEIYDCIIYNDFEEMLKDDNIDVVHICTPHYLHKDMAIKSLKAGKNVVLEKPAAMSEKELGEIVDCADKSKNKLCVVLQNRKNNCVKELKNIIANKKTGELKGIIANLFWKRDEAYYAQDAWRGKWNTEGGGLLINQALHIMDLMLYFGGELDSVKSDIKHWQIKNIEVEDNAQAVLYFKNGAKGIFNATNCYVKDEPFYMEFLFENAHYRYADNRLYEITQEKSSILATDEMVKVGKVYWGNGHAQMIKNFYNVLDGKEGEYTDIHDAKQVMNLLFTIYDEADRKC